MAKSVTQYFKSLFGSFSPTTKGRALKKKRFGGKVKKGSGKFGHFGGFKSF